MEELWPQAEAMDMQFTATRGWGEVEGGACSPFDPRCYCLPGILLSWEPS